MFNKANSEKSTGGIETIIGSSVKVEGDFVGEGDVTVEGAVFGTLKTKGNVFIKQGARVEAEVAANSITSAGVIKGNVTVVKKIELSATAVVEGNIQAETLSVETGARIKGQCLIGAGAGIGVAASGAAEMSEREKKTALKNSTRP